MAARENSPVGQILEKDLTLTRIFHAPREIVFRAFSDPEQMKRWWGPKGFTLPICEVDFRVGGRSFSCMRSPEGKDYCGVGVYKEIVEPERIVVTDSFADENRNIVPATDYGMNSDMPLEMLITVTLENVVEGTMLTLTHEGIPPGDDREDARQGWSESLDKLSEYLLAENLLDEFDE